MYPSRNSERETERERERDREEKRRETERERERERERGREGVRELEIDKRMNAHKMDCNVGLYPHLLVFTSSALIMEVE